MVSNIISDTLFVDEKNGIELGTSGATISDVRSFTFDVDLDPGQTRQVHALWLWEGGVFEDPGNSNADGVIDVTIDVATPEPASLALFSLGLLGPGLLGARRRWR